MSCILEKAKKQRKTTELIQNELESLYILLKIAPNKEKVLNMINERENILKKRGINFNSLKENIK